MRDIQEVLSEKENQLERVRKEIESLHAVIPLLSEEQQHFEPDRKPVSGTQAAGATPSKSSFWNFGRRQG
jgi:prefoldin subunit 5